MPQTQWTKKASTLPSDRFQPSHPRSSAIAKGKGKGHDVLSKSKEVRQLESLLKGLQDGTTAGPGVEKDSKSGCFCLGIPVFMLPYSDNNFVHSSNSLAFTLYSPMRVLWIHSLLS
jgi:hypothetical protein